MIKPTITQADQDFCALVWSALKGDHSDLRKQTIILEAHRYHREDAVAELQAEIERLREALLDARAFIDGDSPDWRYAKQDQLAAIDAALNPQPTGKESGHE